MQNIKYHIFLTIGTILFSLSSPALERKRPMQKAYPLINVKIKVFFQGEKIDVIAKEILKKTTILSEFSSGIKANWQANWGSNFFDAISYSITKRAYLNTRLLDLKGLNHLTHDLHLGGHYQIWQGLYFKYAFNLRQAPVIKILSDETFEIETPWIYGGELGFKITIWNYGENSLKMQLTTSQYLKRQIGTYHYDDGLGYNIELSYHNVNANGGAYGLSAGINNLKQKTSKTTTSSNDVLFAVFTNKRF